ncbi:IpaD/SipD/SspD family type III secretion system needle tip protein [Yersinia mollaretii]|uniref:IpaD/SipD/SspD family type III secretion system needle tip protein n=1 Tax=Yersinia mollaretii TaxID=33060 RepID=UPI001643F69F|nr:IpaD/SipD/SspD family type III secretion system needle tip protein [Yersinia mollaretii]
MTLSVSQGDPYLLAEQLLSQNHGLLPLPEADSYSRVLYPSISPSAEEIQDDSRQLHRDLQKSSDHYNKANANSAARAASTPDDVGTPPHIEALENMISTIHGDYQKTYSEINQKAAEYMKEVNTAVGKISDYIGPGSDGRITFRVSELVDAMDKIFDKYTNGIPNKIYISTQDNDGNFISIPEVTKDDYKNWSPDDSSTKPIYTFKGDDAALNFWEKKLGSGFIVKKGDDGDINILPNLSPIRQIYSSIAHATVGWDSGSGPGEITSQGFQTLQSAIDSQKNAVNSSVSQLLERFRQDNSTFETLIQLLTKMTEDLHRYNAGYIQ